MRKQSSVRRARNELGRYSGLERHIVDSGTLVLNMNKQLMHHITVTGTGTVTIDAAVGGVVDTFLIVIIKESTATVSFDDKFQWSGGGTPPTISDSGRDIIAGLIYDDILDCSIDQDYS